MLDRRVRYPIHSVVTVILIVFSTIVIDTSWKIALENGARTQAKYNLAQIKLCVNNLLLTDEQGLYSNYSKKSLKEIEKSLFICAKNMKVSPNGDVWAYDLHDKHYVFDSNPKYGSIKGRYWSSDKLCKKKGDWCSRLVTIMSSGYDSTWMGYSWLFKHDKEYLEWKVLPDEYLGFDGNTKSGDNRPQQIVVVQGVREKELLTRYKSFRVMLYSIGFLMIIINLALNHYTRNKGRREDDN